MPEYEHHPTNKRPHSLIKPLVIGAVAVIGLGVSFVGGIQYQKGHTAASAATTSDSNGGGFQGRRMMSKDRVFSEVTAVSSSSITVQARMPASSDSSSTVTLAITSGTTVTNNGATGAVSDIQTGDTVMITKTSSSSTTAKNIVLNPSMMGPGTSSDTPGSDTNLNTTTN